MKSPRISEAYDSLSVLGHGPFTTVFKCQHKATQEVHVVKEYLLDVIPRSCVSLLRREADLQAQIQMDSILQPCYTFIDHDSLVLYIVLPFLASRTLHSVIKDAKAKNIYLAEDTIWSTAYSILMTLNELSPLRLRGDDSPAPPLLHCNLKPSNVLFLDENLSMVQLCDCSFDPELRVALSSTRFGLQWKTKPAERSYSMAYVAPEIILHKQVHPTSDLWSLGCILYEMCTFTKLFPDGCSSDSLDQASHSTLPIRKLYGYSDALVDFVNKMLIFDSSKRPTREVLLNHKGMRTFMDGREALYVKGNGDERLSVQSITSNTSVRSNLSTNLGRILPKRPTKLPTSTEPTHVEISSEIISERCSITNADPSLSPRKMFKSTPLIDAVINNDRDLLVSSMSFTGCTDEHGKTALMYAAELSRNDFILYLLPFEKGQEIDGVTALQLAIAAGNDDGADMIACYECPQYSEIQELCNEWMSGKKGVFQEDSINASFVGGRVVPESKTPTISLVESSIQYSSSTPTKEPESPSGLLSSSIDVSPLLTISRSTPSQELSAFRAYASGLRGSRGLSSSELNAIFRTDSTKLMQACSANDVARAWCLRFQAGTRTVEGKTALMCCAESNCILMARVLLDTEVGLLLKDGTTAYEIAFARGNTIIAQMLYKYEALTNSKGKAISSLIRASILGDISILNYLIYHCKKNIKMGNLLQRKISTELLKGCDLEGKTALMYAAEAGNVEVVQLLRMIQARHQMTVNSHLKGRTALMFAARKNHLNCIFPLLHLEARMQDARGWTALMMAAYLGYTSIVKAILVWEHGILLGPSTESPGASALMLAAEAGNVSAVELLLNYEACKQKENGFTALMIAAQEGHCECVNLLVKKEARLTRADGWTALMSATQRNRVDCVKILMAYEAGMRKTTGYTALMCAAQCGWEQCVRLLLPLEWNIVHSNGLSADAFAKTDELRHEIKLFIEFRKRYK